MSSTSTFGSPGSTDCGSSPRSSSAWVAWRWIGFLLGLVRIREFEGPLRREARRSVIARGALNVFFSVAALYLWACVLDAQPGETFVGFLAAAMMCSLAIGVAAGFMQPEERTPETLDVCRVHPRRRERSADMTVFAMSIARVIGPTPPGTGVIARTF